MIPPMTDPAPRKAVRLWPPMPQRRTPSKAWRFLWGGSPVVVEASKEERSRFEQMLDNPFPYAGGWRVTKSLNPGGAPRRSRGRMAEPHRRSIGRAVVGPQRDSCSPEDGESPVNARSGSRLCKGNGKPHRCARHGNCARIPSGANKFVARLRRSVYR
jgi:hypothetical protein